MVFLWIFVFFIGATLGSFLDVIAMRWGTGRGIGGRSSCPHCNRTLVWYELVPFLGWFFVRGKCRTCKALIPVEHPITELVMGLVVLGIYAVVSSPIEMAFFVVIYSILFVLSIYDFHHTIIPDQLSFAFAVLAGLSMFVVPLSFLSPVAPGIFVLPTPWHALAGIIIPLPFLLMWIASRGRWMGLGDVKLMVGIGWLLGLSGGFAALIIAFWLGALVGIILMGLSLLRQSHPRLVMVKKSFIMKSEIPFGPFLVIGTFLVHLFGLDMLSLLYVVT